MRISVILTLVALSAAIAVVFYVACARRRAKRKLVTEGIRDPRHGGAEVVGESALSDRTEAACEIQPTAETPSAKLETTPLITPGGDACPGHEDEVGSTNMAVATAHEIIIEAPENVSVAVETLEPAKEESDVEVVPDKAVTEPPLEEPPEGLAARTPASEDQESVSIITEATEGGAGEGTPANEAKPRQERAPVSPENRGGRSRETTPKNQVETKRKRRPRTQKPEIVCWKREREWILAVELPEDFSEDQNVTVVQDGNPLDADDAKDSCWRLSHLHGEVTVRVLDAENESLVKLVLDDAGCLIFKLSGGDQGRRVKRPSCGSCLVIAPATWKRDEKTAGTALTNPEPVYLDGYQAHFFDLVGNEDSQIAFRNEAGREVVTGASGPQFQLVGEELHDASENRGPLFAGVPPRIHVADGTWETVGIIVLGEEGRGSEKKWRKAFKPNAALPEQEMPVELLNRKAGWYFIRFYDLQHELIDSLDFRFGAGLRQITIRSGQPFPSAAGHEVATVEFEHDADWCVAPLSATPKDVKIEHTAGKTVLKIPPLSDCDLTSWGLGPHGGPQVQVALLIERVWCAVSDMTEPPLQWQDTSLSLSVEDFAATSEKAIWLRLPKPRWADTVLVGFQPEKRRAYPLKVTERLLAIPFRDFSDTPALAERTKDWTLKVWVHGDEAAVAVVPAETLEAPLIVAKISARHLARSLTLLHALTHGPVRQLLKEVRRRYRRPPNSTAGCNAEFVKEALCAIAVLLQLADIQQTLVPKTASRWKRKARLAGKEFPDTMRQVWRRYREIEGRTTRN